ncbi:MAG: hypothetical protein JSU68_04730, partial [Phycisphaerales bacterium]
AAVLYGIGARLDEKPELLFLLRGVDHAELIAGESGKAVAAAAARGSRRRVAGDLADVFGIDLVEEDQAGSKAAPAAATGARRKKKRRTASRSTRSPGAGRDRKRAASSRKQRGAKTKTPGTARTGRAAQASPAPAGRQTRKENAAVSGRSVARLRAKFGMSRSQFARLLAVSASTIANWEGRRGRLKLQFRTLHAWLAVSGLSKEEAWIRLEGA